MLGDTLFGGLFTGCIEKPLVDKIKKGDSYEKIIKFKIRSSMREYQIRSLSPDIADTLFAVQPPAYDKHEIDYTVSHLKLQVHYGGPGGPIPDPLVVGAKMKKLRFTPNGSAANIEILMIVKFTQQGNEKLSELAYDDVKLSLIRTQGELNFEEEKYSAPFYYTYMMAEAEDSPLAVHCSDCLSTLIGEAVIDLDEGIFEPVSIAGSPGNESAPIVFHADDLRRIYHEYMNLDQPAAEAESSGDPNPDFIFSLDEPAEHDNTEGSATAEVVTELAKEETVDNPSADSSAETIIADEQPVASEESLQTKIRFHESQLPMDTVLGILKAKFGSPEVNPEEFNTKDQLIYLAALKEELPDMVDDTPSDIKVSDRILMVKEVEAVKLAICSFAQAKERWQEFFKQDSVTNAMIMEMLRTEMSEGGHGGPDMVDIAHKPKPTPQIWLNCTWPQKGQEPDFKGKQVVELVKQIFGKPE